MAVLMPARITPEELCPRNHHHRIVPEIGYLLALTETFADDRPGVLAVLGRIADPRKRRGVRHRLSAVVGLAVWAALAGVRSYIAIAEWAADPTDHSRRS